MTRTVGILIFDGIEVLDLGGPFEVLSVATRLAGRDGEAAPFQPVLIGASGTPAVGRGGSGYCRTPRWMIIRRWTC
ncbi:hypothetical protein [Deinococcus aquaticus]|uniref:hypothetical protein n=1 Tax=Deinococcus aquaticus TaxID=328692 RepID=UPI00360C9A10